MPDTVRVWRLPYRDARALIADLRRLVDEERFEYILGIVKRRAPGAWECSIEATDPGAEPPNTLIAGLECDRAGCEWEVRASSEWVSRTAERVAILQAEGLWQRPHPWLDLVMPDSAVDDLLPEVLGSPSAGGLDPLRVLLYPLRPNRCHRPLLRLPEEERAFLVDVLSTATDRAAADAMTVSNRALYERNRLQGGTMYPIGALPLAADEWREHFGSRWDELQRAKSRFDPDGVLTPGPGIF
nr:hypothetical protein [uncultured bacterium]